MNIRLHQRCYADPSAVSGEECSIFPRQSKRPSASIYASGLAICICPLISFALMDEQAMFSFSLGKKTSLRSIPMANGGM
jgi:hypothetical protein